ncbi:MAG: SPOR domain-containing protein [Pseudomonadota bacterium]
MQNTDYDHGSYGPPPDDPMTFDATMEQDSGRGRALLALVMVIFVAFAVVIWIAYQQGVRSGNEPPIITADAGPLTGQPSDDAQPQIPNSEAAINSLIEERPPSGVEDVITNEPDDLRALTGDPAQDPASDVIAAAEAEGGRGGPIDSQPDGTLGEGQSAVDVEGIASDAGDAVRQAAEAVKSGAQQIAAAPKATNPPQAVIPDPPGTATPSGAGPDKVAAKPTPKPAAAGRGAREGAFVLQLASFRDAEQTAALWDTVSDRHGSVVGGLRPDIEVKRIADRGTYHRLLIGPFDTRAAADKTCAALKTRNQDCFVRKP